MHIFISWLVLISLSRCCSQQGKLKNVTTSEDFLFLCFSLIVHLYFSLVSCCHSLSFCVSLSLKAVHIQHNNPYKHLFLFMSLSFTRHTSTHANVNTEIGLPWGSFTHQSCEQKARPYLPASAFVVTPDCNPRTHDYRHAHFCHREKNYPDWKALHVDILFFDFYFIFPVLLVSWTPCQ